MQVKRNIIIIIVFIIAFLQFAVAQNVASNEYYEKAYTEMADMLEGNTPIAIR